MFLKWMIKYYYDMVLKCFVIDIVLLVFGFNFIDIIVFLG